MAEYQGEYGHPYPRVDQYGNPVPPVDQYGNPLPREPASGFGAIAPPYNAGDSAAGHVAAPVEYGADAKYPHDGTGSGAAGVTAPTGVVAYSSGGVAPAETALASYEEGMVHLQPTGEEHTFGMASQLQPTHGEEHTFGMASQLQPTGEEHTTLGEKLRRSGSSSSSSEDDEQGGRRKKSIKEKIKEKLPGTHKHEEQKAGHVTTTTGTHAAGTHEKKGFMEKIKEKLPGHHHAH